MPERRRAGGFRRLVPHYRQTTDFTCGPSSCLMAMRSLDGRRPIVLCSTRHVTDPWVSLDKGKTARDMADIPIPRHDFDKMARYGGARERAAVLVRMTGATKP